MALGARTHIWGIYGDTLLHTFNRSNINTDFFRELIRLGAHVNPKRTDPEGYGKYRVPDSKRAPWVQYLGQPPLHHLISQSALPLVQILVRFVLNY